MKTRLATCLLIFGAFACSTHASDAQLTDLLHSEADISIADLNALGEGVLAKELKVDDRSQGLGLVGIIRLDTTAAALHWAAANIGRVPRSMRPDSIQALNFIPDPPPTSAFATFELTATQVKALESCRVNKCRMKLPEPLIRQSQRDGGQPFVHLYRNALTDLVRNYRGAGDVALWTYRDKPDPLHASDGFNAALGAIESAPQLIPEVTSYFQQFPAELPEGAMADFMFWSILDFGHRPTLTINHALSIQPDNPKLDYLFAIKTIYANHYFSGRASFGALVENNALGAPGRFFVLIEHLQFDGRLNRLLRAALSRGIVKDVEARLEMIRGLSTLSRSQSNEAG